jgi:hypothetical protein
MEPHRMCVETENWNGLYVSVNSGRVASENVEQTEGILNLYKEEE